VTVAIRSPSNGRRNTNHELGGQLTLFLAHLFDHLVGEGKQHGRDFDAEGLGSLDAGAFVPNGSYSPTVTAPARRKFVTFGTIQRRLSLRELLYSDFRPASAGLL
jgi:hypothetical protein